MPDTAKTAEDIALKLSNQDCTNVVKEIAKQDRLGSGKYGSIHDYSKCDVKEKKCVVKTIKFNNRDTYWTNLENRRNYTLEVDALKKLTGLNVAPDFGGAFYCRNSGYIVMEKLEGRTLYEYIVWEHGKITAHLIRDIARKFQAIHKHGIVHSDGHTQNIFVLNDGKNSIRIVDFGLVVKKYPPDFDFAAIAWHIVAILYEQNRPFEAVDKMIRKVLNEEFSESYDIPKFDPSHRPEDFFYHNIEEIEEESL